MNKDIFAAIDLGTNSCRLVIADENGNYLYSDTVSTRLGEGMQKEMRFTDEAVERGVRCFCKYKKQMDKYGVTKCRAIATASCRMASNGDDFVQMVKDQAGIQIEVVDGIEEARLNLKGALMHVCDKTDYVVVYDLGGGSTEITLATNSNNPEILYTVSIPWGARNAAEAFDICDYDAQKAEQLKLEISKYVDEFVQKACLKDYIDRCCLVATSSTPLRLVSYVLQTGDYNREETDGKTVSVSEIDRVVAEINTMKQSQMATCPYIGEKRSFIFQAACVIFKTIYEQLGINEITASLKSAKDGIIEEMVKEYGKAN